MMRTGYIKKRGGLYVVLNKAGRTISRHRTRSRAEASFRAMMASKRRIAKNQQRRRT